MTTILAADIGGTHSRFMSFTLPDGQNGPGGAADLRPGDEAWIPTDSVDSFAGLLGALKDKGFPHAPDTVEATVLAVPGPVEGGRRAEPANIPWAIDLDDEEAGVAGLCVHLINDFVAQGYASRTVILDQAELVKPGTGDPTAALAVVGAGTGLGHCATLPASGKGGQGGFLAVPAEAGHAAFPFVGEHEEAYHAFLRRTLSIPYAYGDVVVSGSGLAHLHRFLTDEALSPEEVAERAGRASPTVRLFSRFYGRAVRNYVLSVVGFAGVMVTGGVAAKSPWLVDNDDFREEFVSSPRYGAQLARVPVRLCRDERSGLFGAAFYGAQTLGPSSSAAGPEK